MEGFEILSDGLLTGGGEPGDSGATWFASSSPGQVVTDATRAKSGSKYLLLSSNLIPDDNIGRNASTLFFTYAKSSSRIAEVLIANLSAGTLTVNARKWYNYQIDPILQVYQDDILIMSQKIYHAHYCAYTPPVEAGTDVTLRFELVHEDCYGHILLDDISWS